MSPALAKMMKLEQGIRDISERLTRIEQTPLPLWMKDARSPDSAAPRYEVGALTKSASETDSALLARLLADPLLGAAVRERVATLQPGRLP